MKNNQPIKEKKGLTYESTWKQLLENKSFAKELCGDVLEDYIVKQRWYGGKSSAIKYIELLDFFEVEEKIDLFYGLVLEINYEEAFVQDYFLPIGIVTHAKAVNGNVISEIFLKDKKFHLVDACYLDSFRKLIFNKILEGSKEKYNCLEYRKGLKCQATTYENSRFLWVEQSNTSIIYNEKYILKFFRRLYVNHNPDYEISKYLTSKGEFKNTPGYAGSITLKFSDKNVMTIALMQEMILNEGDAWEYFSATIKESFLQLSKLQIDVSKIKKLKKYEQIPAEGVTKYITSWTGTELFEDVRKIALRTAEMHVSLGSERINVDFTPTSYSYDYTVWLKNRLMYMLDNRINLIENNLHKLEGLQLQYAMHLLEQKKEVKKRFLDYDENKLKGERIRIHGDYHLGQILVNKRDFYVIDFEGEPESTIRDRKVKQPPIKDVAGMFRSFNYVIYASIFNNATQYVHRLEDLFEVADALYSNMIGVFLHTYIDHVQSQNLNIGYQKEIEFLLEYCLLEKAIYELGYELNSRPHWAIIPLKGIANILNNNT